MLFVYLGEQPRTYEMLTELPETCKATLFLQPGVERELLARGEIRQDYIRGGPVEIGRTSYTFDDYGFG